MSASSGGVTVRTVARHTDDLRGKGHAALRDLVPTVRFTRAQTRRLVAAGGAVTLRATGRQTLVAEKGGRVTRARSGAVTGVQTMASARTAQNLWSNGQKVVVGYMVPDDSSDTYTGGSFNGSVDHGCTKVTSGHPYYFQAWACTGDLGYYPQGTLANVDSQDSGDDITFGAGYNEHDQSVPQASCTLVNADIGQCQVTRTVQQGSQNQGTCMHYGDSNELTCEWAQYDYEAGITA